MIDLWQKLRLLLVMSHPSCLYEYAPDGMALLRVRIPLLIVAFLVLDWRTAIPLSDPRRIEAYLSAQAHAVFNTIEGARPQAQLSTYSPRELSQIVRTLTTLSALESLPSEERWWALMKVRAPQRGGLSVGAAHKKMYSH